MGSGHADNEDAAPPFANCAAGSAEGDGRGGGPSGSPRGKLRPGVTELLIVRHGETAWNAESRVQGQLDIELNEIGRSQASSLAQSLLRRGYADRIDAVISSDLSRASQTADEIATVCKNAKRSKDPDLREVHFGEFQGTSSKENPVLKVRRERVHSAWKRGEWKHRHPGGGETGAAVVERGLRGLRAAAGSGSCVVIVSHGGLIKWSAVGAELTGGKLEAGDIFDTVPDPFDQAGESTEVAGHGEEGLPAPEEMQAAMSSQRVKVAFTSFNALTLRWRSPRSCRSALWTLLSTPITNCCVSTVLFDHTTGELTPVRWYEDMCAAEGRDDTG